MQISARLPPPPSLLPPPPTQNALPTPAPTLPPSPSPGQSEYGAPPNGASQTNQQPTLDQDKLALATLPITGPLVNPIDGALIQCSRDHTKVSITLPNGMKETWYSQSLGESLELPSGAFIGCLKGKIGLDKNGVEVAVDDAQDDAQGNTELFAPETNGRWVPLGPLHSMHTQQVLSHYFDEQERRYLNDAYTFSGNLGYLDAYDGLGFAPSSLMVLQAAQEERDQARQKELAQAAQSAQSAQAPSAPSS